VFNAEEITRVTERIAVGFGKGRHQDASIYVPEADAKPLWRFQHLWSTDTL